MRRLSQERLGEIWLLLIECKLRRRGIIADTFFPESAGKVLPGQVAHALASRAGPTSDYLSPPQVSRARVEFAAATLPRLREWWEDRPDFDMGPGGGRLRPGS